MAHVAGRCAFAHAQAPVQACAAKNELLGVTLADRRADRSSPPSHRRSAPSTFGAVSAMEVMTVMRRPRVRPPARLSPRWCHAQICWETLLERRRAACGSPACARPNAPICGACLTRLTADGANEATPSTMMPTAPTAVKVSAVDGWSAASQAGLWIGASTSAAWPTGDRGRRQYLAGSDADGHAGDAGQPDRAIADDVDVALEHENPPAVVLVDRHDDGARIAHRRVHGSRFSG